ncbi:hypothetical protein FDECE_909 [Fusarium decemcellulare]|nr:hypothetical protein FDECE_909 [Fusarium decemcellulare]
MRSSTLIALATVLSKSSAFIDRQPHQPSQNATLDIFASIPSVQNLENLAVRHNGEIVVTSSTSPSLHLVASEGGLVGRVATIPDATSLSGITELEKNVFYVVAANVTGPDPIAIGTNAVWKVDLRDVEITEYGAVTKSARVSLVTKIPLAGLLNGMTRLSAEDDSHLLLSDSALGRILLLNVRNKKYETVLEDETTAGRPERLVAVNGIRTYDQHIFYVNQVRALFAKVPISTSTGRADGPPEVIINGTLPYADDFALSHDGKRAWVALNSQNVIVEVDILAQTSTVIINSTELGEGSSVAVAPSTPRSRSLYVTGSSVVDGRSIGAVFKVDTH